MTSVYRDTHGILFIDDLERQQTINNDRYVAQLEHLKEEIEKKTPHVKSKKCSYHTV